MQDRQHKRDLIEIRASLIYNFLNKLKQKAKDEQAVIFYEGCQIEIENIIAEEDYCAVKYTNYVSTTLFRIPENDELLYSTVKELQTWLKSCFKLYKEIKI